MSKFYISGRNQTRTATPSNIQQTITPQEGFNALDAVVVNPIKAAMPQTLEQFIMRDDNIEPFSVNLDGDVPDYACYRQKKLVAVYGIPTSIGNLAFIGCNVLEEVSSENITEIKGNAFESCYNLQNFNGKNVTVIGGYSFESCTAIKTIDFRKLDILAARALAGCNSLFAVDLRICSKIAGNLTIGASRNLRIIDLTSSHSCVLEAANSIPDSTYLTILVADATDKAYYQSATNWSTYASKIKTVAEYEQQIGMSYDNYYEIVFGHPRFDNVA